MNRITSFLALSWLFCLGSLFLCFGRTGIQLLTTEELGSRGGSVMVCICPSVSCVSLNPNINQKGGPGCQKAGDACQACPKPGNTEELWTPINNCGTTCNGANKQKRGATLVCQGSLSNGTCQKSAQGNPFPFVCANLQATENNCLPTNIQVYPPVGQ